MSSFVARLLIKKRRFSTTSFHRCFSSTTRTSVQRRNTTTSSHIQVSAHHRSHLIFGANTDIGKTVISAGLVRASAHRGTGTTHYIKPLQCGGSDQEFVERHTSQQQNVAAQTLFQWDTPASPHTACRVENRPVSDDQVMDQLESVLATFSSTTKPTTTWIETAGGVLSPAAASPDNISPRHASSSSNDTNSWGWIPQADLYQPLLGVAPAILVGDGRLGGIAATLSALESLLVRGYDVSAVVLIESEDYDNASALREYAQRKFAVRSGSGEALLTNPVQSIVALPPIPVDPEVPLHGWYESTQVTDTFSSLNEHLQQSWEGHVADLQELRSAARQVVWWPFTQHGNVESDDKVTLIDSAAGDHFSVLVDSSSKETSNSKSLERVPMFDACASWWTQGVGHGDSSMALAAASAAGRYGHVIFPDVAHAPAVALSQYLTSSHGPGAKWADRVFFTDDGSTAMEVAVKMGIKLYQKRVGEEENDDIDWVVCAQEDCYHGDTLGVMDVAEPSIFNEGQHPWYEPKGLFLGTPTLGFKDGVLSIQFPEGFETESDSSFEFDSIEQAVDVDARLLTKLYTQYSELIELQWAVYEHVGVNRKISSVVLEPVLMGAGGMKFVDPLWQRALMNAAKARNVPVIFDEVASGLYRVGVKSCREILKSSPDIGCYAKLLTGGLLPLSVTLATEEVFETFLGDEKGQALLHGHSYTAHPIGCVSALHALEAYRAALETEESMSKNQTSIRMLFDAEQTRALSRLPLVAQSFTLGTVLAVTIHPETGSSSGYGASSRTVPIVERLRRQGVYGRPLGNVVYIMASPLTSKEECARLVDILHSTIEDFGKEIS